MKLANEFAAAGKASEVVDMLGRMREDVATKARLPVAEVPRDSDESGFLSIVIDFTVALALVFMTADL